MKIKKRSKSRKVIDRKRFLSALNEITPGLESQEMADDLPTYIFDGQNIMSMNDHIVIKKPFTTKLNCRVPASELFKIIGKLKSDDIKVLMSNKNREILIRSERIKSKINCFENDEESERIEKIIGSVEGKRFNVLPKDFIRGIKMCLFSVSTDANLPILNCIFIDKDKIVASDEQRLSVFYLDKPLSKSYLLPAKTAKKLVDYDVVKYAVVNSMMFFLTRGDTIIACGLYDGIYQDCYQYFDFKGETIEFPETAIDDLEVVSVMTDGAKDLSDTGIGEYENIEVEIDGDKITMLGSKDIGSSEAEFKVKSSFKKKKKMKFNVNPEFLGEVLNKTKILKIGKDRALFETEQYKHLVYLHS
jgi:DNA polymerase III sliding clamp (beta) subunit (PCNA family)